MKRLPHTVSEVIELLDRSGLMDGATVFGSLLDRPHEAKDVDVAFVLDTPYSAEVLNKHRPLLSAGAYGSHRYGALDVFVCFSDCMWVRDGDCRSFVAAKNVRALRAAIKNGRPWPEWRLSVLLANEDAPVLARDAEGQPPPKTAPSAETLETLRKSIVSALDPSMLRPPYDGQWSAQNPTYGFCSIASEAAWFLLGGKEAGWVAYNARDTDNSTHWWLEHTSGLRFDPTADQYYRVGTVPPYERGIPGRPGGFMGMRRDEQSVWGNGRRPGLRAAELLDRMGATPVANAPIKRQRWKM